MTLKRVLPSLWFLPISMLRILLIRHGVTELTGNVLYGRMPDVHISAEGHRQAQALSRAICERYAVSAVISSPLERALETAGYLAGACRLPIKTDQDWIELDYGGWMGKTFTEIRDSPDWQHYNRLRSTACPPGGEMLVQVQTRAWSALARLLTEFEDQDDCAVAVVSHGDVIRALLVLLLGMPLDYIHRFDVAPASLSEISFEGRHSRVIRINQIYY